GAIAGRPRIEAEPLELVDDAAIGATSYSTEGLALRAAPGVDGPLAAVTARIAGFQRDGARVVLVGTTEPQRDRLVALLAGHGIPATPTRAPLPQALETPGRAALALTGELTRGAWLPADGLAVVTEAEIFGE